MLAVGQVARQLRLRDLAGLVVVDFIDMEESRHNRDVERRLKEAMRSDRARIQLGRVSPFGLLELSRQRLRPSLFESSTEMCPRCGGTGHVRSVNSSALAVLRSLEEEGLRGREDNTRVAVPTAVALYLLNQFRNRLIEIEQRYGFKIAVEADDTLLSDDYRLDRVTQPTSPASEPAADDEDASRKRRRGRRRRRPGEEETAAEDARPAEPDAAVEEDRGEGREEARDAAGESDDAKKGRRRRGRRGGRRRSRRRPEGPETPEALEAANGASPDASAEATAEHTAEQTPRAPEEPGFDETAEAEEPAPEASVEAPEDEAREQPRANRRGRPRKARPRSRAQPAAAEGNGSDVAAVGSEPTGEETAESETGTGAGRSRRSPAKRPRRPRGDRKPRRSEAEAPAETTGAPRASNSEPPAESRPESRPQDEPRGAERIEAPEGSGREDLPAAAASSGGAPEPGREGDEDDLPKRRGWWNRWV